MDFKTVSIEEGSNIEYSSAELLFLAKSGQPYRGTLYVKFRSINETFDLHDFKHYITSLRTKSLNAEDIAFNIFKTIAKNIKCDDLGVLVDLSARGGIKQRISFGKEFIEHKKTNIFQI
ncbi:hypothetical protein [Sulfurimonas sp.]|jgi:NADPH-dependent 7-cyano-7-deazaguanine reductase QueF|uniref:hypothetical protein n=1 Tax=Sulfurimonas sp. TaxID=2022749 RepID=UPI0025E17DB1|nr:hypothetical protein [Sulfurimonas sp.]MBT5934511.1 hypothetical protein [Sulfurimonas sp.]